MADLVDGARLRLVSNMSFRDSTGNFVIVAEAENTHTRTLRFATLDLVVYDAAGHQLVRKREPSPAWSIPPGGTAPFIVHTPDPEKALVFFDLVASGPFLGVDEKPLPSFLSTRIVSQGVEAKARAWAEVRVENHANVSQNATVIVSFYDAEARLIGLVSGTAEPSPLQAGGTARFLAEIYDLADQVANVRAETKNERS